MGKRIWLTVLAMALILSVPMKVSAETAQVRGKVSFTDPDKRTLDSEGTNLNAAVGALQPGDGLDILIDVVNGSDMTVNYYMTNEVLSSLEDTEGKNAEGGAYEYILSYQGPSQTEPRYLFRSTVLGGDGSEGLNTATEGMEEYIYLDTLGPGQSGVVRLWVALDGETQGNSYQGTAANLRFDFAVDTVMNQENKVVEKETVTEIIYKVDDTAPTPPPGSGLVKTGDDTNLPLYITVAGVSGLLLLVLAFFSIRERKRQRRGGKTLGLFLALILAAVPLSAEAAEYTYTVRLYAGAQGILTGGVVVDIRDQEDRDVLAERSVAVAQDGSCVTISGLLYNDKIIFDVATPVEGQGAVDIRETEAGVKKYYVRGLRESGADTSSHDETGIGFSGYRVTEDKDYVVAYGIRGNMTRYTVIYEDREGNALLPAQTYQGKAGDYVVAAYRYIQYYSPYAYNLGKTLSSNEEENVFRFVYNPIPVVSTVIRETETEYETVLVPASPAPAQPGQQGQQPGQNQPGQEDQNQPGQEDQNQPGQNQPGQEDQNQPGQEENPGGEQPPEDFVNLDDENLPQAGNEGDSLGGTPGQDGEISIGDGMTPGASLPRAVKAGLAAGLLVVLGGGAIWLMFMVLRKKAKEEKETDDGKK